MLKNTTFSMNQFIFLGHSKIRDLTIPALLFVKPVIISVLLILGAFPTSAQVKIDLSSDTARIHTANELITYAKIEKEKALAVAKQKGWSIQGTTAEGAAYKLMYVKDNQPIYYLNNNENAAITTATNLVRNVAPYNLNGSNITVGIWDGHTVMATHQEFVNPSRVTVQTGQDAFDPTKWETWHATHVCGTLAAKGEVQRAMGMAPSISVISYDYESDTGEMAARAAIVPADQNNFYLSNHSYGESSGWTEGDFSLLHGSFLQNLFF